MTFTFSLRSRRIKVIFSYVSVKAFPIKLIFHILKLYLGINLSFYIYVLVPEDEAMISK